MKFTFFEQKSNPFFMKISIEMDIPKTKALMLSTGCPNKFEFIEKHLVRKSTIVIDN